jgi:hypothetical protein
MNDLIFFSFLPSSASGLSSEPREHLLAGRKIDGRLMDEWCCMNYEARTEWISRQRESGAKVVNFQSPQPSSILHSRMSINSPASICDRLGDER